MTFSIFTPVHPTSVPFLLDAWDSLMRQTYTDWEWVIVPNGGVELPPAVLTDSRIRVVPATDTLVGVGALKRFACAQSRGDVLVELDADDLLMPTALFELAVVFKKPEIVFAYSNDASFDSVTWHSEGYSACFGWITRDIEWQGHALKELVAWDPSAHMMRMVYWAPDHVRAWRRSAYEAIGGHDASLIVGDDHDLCCRTYLHAGMAGMAHIDQCLYLYRVHAANSVKTFNAQIQEQTLRNYLRYSRELAVRWARDHQLRCLDLGGRFNAWSGFETVDLQDAAVVTDLNGPWPFDDSSVGVIHASHVFEHLKDSIHTMNEAFRVLAPGGFLFIDVPSTDGRGAFQDPTHVSFWNENSIRYYTNEQYAQFIRPAFTGRFQNLRTVTYDPFKDPTVPVVQADLVALKPPYSLRPVGEVLI